GASFIQGTVSSIPFVGSISPEGFLPPILLLVVIIVTVIVMVVVVVAVGGVPSILKLSFMVIGFFLGTILLYQESFKFRPGTKKYRGSNSSDGSNTGDGVKIAGGVIGPGGGIGEISSFLEFSKKSEEMFPGVAGK
ncbi:hypothetical protein Tco_1234278, partial [Tanacetum coccineum]